MPYSYCYIVPCDDREAYLVRYYFYSAVYISGSFTITDPIPGFQNIIIRVTDKAYMAESSSSGPRKFNALVIFIVCVLPILFFFFFFFFNSLIGNTDFLVQSKCYHSFKKKSK